MSTKEICLVSPPTETYRTPEGNLGIAYLAAESRKNGHGVVLIDSWLSGWSVSQTVDRIMDRPYDIVGLSPSMDSTSQAILISNELRKRGFNGQIIMGGVYASFEAEDILRANAADAILTGEADETFQQYVTDTDDTQIPGLVYQSQHEIVRLPKQVAEIDLNTLPYPARDDLDLLEQWKTPIHVMGSKGCYGNCSFCSVVCFHKLSNEKRWRGRSPESIVEELKQLSANGVRMVKFVDDEFFAPGKTGREMEFANRLIDANLNIRFRLSLRVNDVEDDVIGKLKTAGLFAVSLGVESFVTRKLKDYAKGTSVEQNFRAVKILEKHGIFVQMGHIMFDPFTTLEEIEQELDGLSKTRWVVTKGIATKLFAADGTRITERIQKEIGFVGKEGANNLYEIIDPRVNRVYQALRRWNIHHAQLYDMAIDPISAPKNIHQDLMARLHTNCQLLKDMDIQVARWLVDQVKIGGDCDLVIQKAIEIFESELKIIQKEVTDIYLLAGLQYTAGINKRM